jgi:hypothetical protein
MFVDALTVYSWSGRERFRPTTIINVKRRGIPLLEAGMKKKTKVRAISPYNRSRKTISRTQKIQGTTLYQIKCSWEIVHGIDSQAHVPLWVVSTRYFYNRTRKNAGQRGGSGRPKFSMIPQRNHNRRLSVCRAALHRICVPCRLEGFLCDKCRMTTDRLSFVVIRTRLLHDSANLIFIGAVQCNTVHFGTEDAT